jgi:arylsulfatase A
LVVEEAVRWLQEKRDPAKPFFLSVWTHEPHYPIKSDPKFKALYPKLEDDVQKEHHANVTQMDAAFGRLMAVLESLNVVENTFVFFTSDNGPEGDGIKSPGRGSSGGLRGRKRDLHEGGIRVPGMARWPGHIPAGKTVDVPVIGSDLLPTVLAITGAGSSPLGKRTLDGVDVSKVLTGDRRAVERPQPLFWRLDMAPNAKAALRVGDLKVLVDGDRKNFELYDLGKDPRETTDLKQDHPEDFTRLKDKLLSHLAEVDAEGPEWIYRLSPNGAKSMDSKPPRQK